MEEISARLLKVHSNCPEDQFDAKRSFWKNDTVLSKRNWAQNFTRVTKRNQQVDKTALFCPGLIFWKKSIFWRETTFCKLVEFCGIKIRQACPIFILSSWGIFRVYTLVMKTKILFYRCLPERELIGFSVHSKIRGGAMEVVGFQNSILSADENIESERAFFYFIKKSKFIYSFRTRRKKRFGVSRKKNWSGNLSIGS